MTPEQTERLARRTRIAALYAGLATIVAYIFTIAIMPVLFVGLLQQNHRLQQRIRILEARDERPLNVVVRMPDIHPPQPKSAKP